MLDIYATSVDYDPRRETSTPVAASEILLKPALQKINQKPSRQPSMFIHKTGVDFPIRKMSRGSQPPFGVPIFIMILQKSESNCTPVTKVAFHFQSGLFSNKTAFCYKYSVVGYKDCFLLQSSILSFN